MAKAQKVKVPQRAAPVIRNGKVGKAIPQCRNVGPNGRRCTLDAGGHTKHLAFFGPNHEQWQIERW